MRTKRIFAIVVTLVLGLSVLPGASPVVASSKVRFDLEKEKSENE